VDFCWRRWHSSPPVALPLHTAHAAEARRDLDASMLTLQNLFERSGLPGMALSVVEGDNVDLCPRFRRGRR